MGMTFYILIYTQRIRYYNLESLKHTAIQVNCNKILVLNLRLLKSKHLHGNSLISMIFRWNLPTTQGFITLPGFLPACLRGSLAIH